MTEASSPVPYSVLPYSVLYESNQALVIDKPAGLPAHPGPRGGPSVEDWFPEMSRRRDGPWLAHRLDTDTAGCLAIALRKQTLLAMQSCFASGLAGKRYWAIVQGVCPDMVDIDTPLKKISHPKHGWRMTGAKDGQAARTTLRRIGTNGAVSWVELELHTGRTHQARVHCAGLGLPILGDPVYGERNAVSPMLQLMSRRLVLPLPGGVIDATAPPPLHMRKLLAECGYRPSQEQ